MFNKIPVLFSFSGGKDANLALYKLMNNEAYEVKGLFSTFNKSNDRISMHGVRKELLAEQAKQMGLPITFIPIPEKTDMETYSSIMHNFLTEQKQKGINTIGFGDIFLEDLKEYRENKLKEVGMNAVFPLWKKETKDVLNDFLSLGFRTLTVCIDNSKLEKSFVGKEITSSFKDELPIHVDCCGENGEFHTFVFDGPNYKNPIHFSLGNKVFKTYETQEKGYGFWFCDLVL